MKRISGIEMFESGSELEKGQAASARFRSRLYWAVLIGAVASLVLIAISYLVSPEHPNPALFLFIAAPAAVSFSLVLGGPILIDRKENLVSPCDGDILNRIEERSKAFPESMAIIDDLKAQARVPTRREAHEILDLIEHLETEHAHSKFTASHNGS